jgi:iron complex transport system permease protein
MNSAARRVPSRPRGAALTDAQSIAFRRSRVAVATAGLILVLIGVFVLSIALGSIRIPIRDIVSVLTGETVTRTTSVIIRDVRLPRSLTAILAGAALGIAGLQMQTLFRNALADPYVLGITAGASLGVALVVLGGGATVSGVFAGGLGLTEDAAITLAAIIGASASLTLVLGLSSRVQNPTTILILGLMFGYGTSAFVTILLAGTAPERLQEWVAWGFGSFSGVTWGRLRIFAPVVLAGISISWATTKQLNALLLGENYAQSMGLSVRRIRLVTMIAASMLGGVVTAFCGPILFLGVAIPHLCRVLLSTSDHRALIPAVVLMGGIVALAAQIASLLPGDKGVLPLNAVTSLIGAPVVVAVLLRSNRGIFTG